MIGYHALSPTRARSLRPQPAISWNSEMIDERGWSAQAFVRPPPHGGARASHGAEVPPPERDAKPTTPAVRRIRTDRPPWSSDHGARVGRASSFEDPTPCLVQTNPTARPSDEPGDWAPSDRRIRDRSTSLARVRPNPAARSSKRTRPSCPCHRTRLRARPNEPGCVLVRTNPAACPPRRARPLDSFRRGRCDRCKHHARMHAPGRMPIPSEPGLARLQRRSAQNFQSR